VKDRVATLFVGLLLGFALSRAGFSRWDEIHAMFTFSEFRLTLGFATGALVLAVAWRVIARMTGARWPARRFHRGTVPGAILFGAGWALAGACPGIVFVQLGEGQLGALATLAGIFTGNWLHAVVQERWLRWSTGSCDA
jgi:uncharacterized membrane protein YedE/YeeE